MRARPPLPKGIAAAACLLAAGGATGCGLNVTSPDLFQLTRTGTGNRLTLVVNDGGTIRCDGGPARALPDQLLLKARAIVRDLDTDAKAGLRIAATPQSVFSYTLEMQDGTIAFPDTAAGTHRELAPAEEFAATAERGPCRAP